MFVRFKQKSNKCFWNEKSVIWSCNGLGRPHTATWKELVRAKLRNQNKLESFRCQSEEKEARLAIIYGNKCQFQISWTYYDERNLSLFVSNLISFK
jgi:hypothetical protein